MKKGQVNSWILAVSFLHFIRTGKKFSKVVGYRN